MPEHETESGVCQEPCDRAGGTISNAFQFVGTGRGGYQKVEKLVWVGEGKGSFNADVNIWELRKQRIKYYLCMAFYKGTLAMVLICLLFGFALMIPPVAKRLNSALPVSTILGRMHRGQHNEFVSLRGRSFETPQASGTLHTGTDDPLLVTTSTSTTPLDASDMATTPVEHHAAPEQTPQAGCEIMGVFEGLRVPCGYRIKLIAAKAFAGSLTGCQQAAAVVQWQDPACAQCTVPASGCQNVTPTSTNEGETSDTVSVAGFPTNSLY